MGCQTSLNLKVIISIVSFKQNMNLKIQILAGNTLMSRFHVGFEIELPLGIWKSYHCSCKVKNLNQFWWLKGLHAATAAASLCFLGKVCGKIHVCPAWVAASQPAGSPASWPVNLTVLEFLALGIKQSGDAAAALLYSQQWEMKSCNSAQQNIFQIPNLRSRLAGNRRS